MKNRLVYLEKNAKDIKADKEKGLTVFRNSKSPQPLKSSLNEDMLVQNI